MKHKRNLQNITGSILGVLSLAGMTTTSLGAGFQLSERSVKGLGRAFSGEAAIADDASVIASNPAGMTLLPGTQVTAGFFALGIDVGVDARNSATGQTAFTDSAAPNAIIPTLFISHEVDDQLTLGVGVFSSYGLRSDYSGDILPVIGADHSNIFTVNVNPSMAFQLTDKLSFGAGLNFTYISGEITSVSTVVDSPIGLRPIPSFGLTGNDWLLGYNVGFLYEPIKGTRIGLSYRSAMKVDLEGSATIGTELDAATQGTPFATSVAGDYDGSLATTLPAIFEFSVYHELTNRLAVHGDVTWTQWSLFKEIAPKVGDDAIDQELYGPAKWKDSYRVSVGATYAATEKLTLRAGVAWDQSPVEDEYRTFRIPDAERYWVSCGASYAVNDSFVLDVGYTHIFIEDSRIGDTHENATSYNTGGVDIFGLGATYRY